MSWLSQTASFNVVCILLSTHRVPGLFWRWEFKDRWESLALMKFPTRWELETMKTLLPKKGLLSCPSLLTLQTNLPTAHTLPHTGASTSGSGCGLF